MSLVLLDLSCLDVLRFWNFGSWDNREIAIFHLILYFLLHCPDKVIPIVLFHGLVLGLLVALYAINWCSISSHDGNIASRQQISLSMLCMVTSLTSTNIALISCLTG
jgi:hypothetical protein